MTHYDDPFDAAANATLTPRTFYGQLTLEAWYCVLEKGIGKRPFDPQTHRIEDRRTALRLELMPLPEMNLQRPMQRELIAESKEWINIILPSLRSFVTKSPKEIDQAYVALKVVPRGDTYVDKNTGETKESTTFQIAARYADEAACRAAYEAGNGNGNGHTNHAAPPAPATPAGNPEQAAAAKFLAVIVKQCKGDVDLIAQKISAMPLLSKFYTIQSPEVIDLIAAEYAGAITA